MDQNPSSDENEVEIGQGEDNQIYLSKLEGSETKKRKRKQKEDEFKFFDDRLKSLPQGKVERREFSEEWINKWRNLLQKQQKK